MSKDEISVSTTEGEREKAINFLLSLRGKYIISQAIHLAVQQLDHVKGGFREESNIEDMKYINEYFGLGAMLQDIDTPFKDEDFKDEE